MKVFNKTLNIIIPIVILFAGGVILYQLISADLKDKDTDKEVVEQRIKVKNPTYKYNPDAYIVDYDNRVTSDIPTDKPLWVEDVIDYNVLLVSFPVEQSGVSIIELEELPIHRLGYPVPRNITYPGRLWVGKYGACWRKGIINYLNNFILDRQVYLSVSKPPKDSSLGSKLNYFPTYRVLFPDNSLNNELVDLVEFLILNGYGGAWVEDFSAKDITYGSLLDAQEVAALSERGLWKSCDY